ncbi:hypothetical protein NYE69_26960 [Paenibacillus sp. FSL R5-0527]|uniref:hypothetical protein n=1 Tax=Paenibacillus sp. FSL R5-0527 TaxID=2975321 RepID=UPI000979E417|nr:hypothetical protein BK140_22525 [Paenibacillus macerans]
MFTERVLKNIQIRELKLFLSENDVKGRTTRINASSTELKYTEYLKLLEEEILSEEEGTLTPEIVDQFVFEHLFYANNNIHYIYRFNSYFHENPKSIDDLVPLFTRIPQLNYNQSLVDWDDNTDRINLCTTRADFFENRQLKSLHFLFRIAVLSLEYGRTSVFCGVTLDFEHDFLIMKFNQNQFSRMEGEPLSIINSIKTVLSGGGTFDGTFSWMDISLKQLNEDSVNSTIYKLFADLSLEAEAILDSKMTEETIHHIESFMKNVGLNELDSKIKEEYVKQIKAVIYQDISRTMEEKRFQKGWVFKLGFREGDYSRASQNAEKRSPVYSQQVFWQLKEIIHRTGKMQEGGFHWKFPGSYVDVRIESKNGALLVYYYSRLRVGRREKEEYVLRKVAENF